MTPMMKQYFEFKEKFKDAILFYRVGDFFEMFYDDAKVASRVLEIALTGKDCGEEERAPMCGVPFHAADTYIGRLVSRGFKVAVCEQVEDPATAKGIVKRDIVRIVTPGTVTDGALLNEGQNNYICSIFLSDECAGLCFADISTGEMSAVKEYAPNHIQKIINQLAVYKPREVICNTSFSSAAQLAAYIKDKGDVFTRESCEEFFSPSQASEIYGRQFGFSQADIDAEETEIVRAAGALLLYICDTQKSRGLNISKINVYTEEQYLNLDVNTRRNLELCETMRAKEKRGSLLWVLDSTKTAMGARLLSKWITLPLINARKIYERQNAVQELFDSLPLRDELSDILRPVLDIERIMAKVVYGTANPQDLRSLYNTLMQLPAAKALLKNCSSELMRELYASIDTLDDITSLIDRSIVENPTSILRDGGFIKDGYNAEVDRCNELMRNGKDIVRGIEEREKERTGIKNLKVRYNKVFGYYIEISNSNLSEIPSDYIRKQTLVNGERFITEELKRTESEILGAAERDAALEFELFTEIRTAVSEQYLRIQRSAEALAAADALCSLAETAAKNNYVRPEVDYGEEIEIKDGRHPVVEQFMKDSYFVPNDTQLDTGPNKVMLITGPNMAGKSTYMRQVALICIMAQAGSFVPASSARIGIVDKIFTRVGASDDLASGMSTFMLEMNEVSYILRNATKRSLIIYDEIGRGTSTFDGMSIARAVCEYTAGKKIGAKTLFATHYHELTELESINPDIKNYNIAAKKKGDDLIFLRKIVRGAADDSYGIEVAKLAGIPNEIIKRAKDILSSLISGEQTLKVPDRKEDTDGGLSFYDIANSEVVEKLKEVNIDTMSPIEALTFLYELKKSVM